MKAVHLLLFLPLFGFAQSADSCNKTSLLFSRELYPETLTVERAIALSGLESSCLQDLSQDNLTLPQFRGVSERQPYTYFPIHDYPQDVNGRDLFLGVVTEQLINHLIFDRLKQ